jgi:hypothetical protein
MTWALSRSRGRFGRCLAGAPWFGRAAFLAAVLASDIGPGPARASDASDCAAINGGGLDLELGAVAEERRQARLAAGDTIDFIIEKPAGSLATLRLVAAWPRLLLAAPEHGTVSFTADRRGLVEFVFAVEGDEGARLSARCTETRRGRKTASRGKEQVARRAEKLLSEYPGLIEIETAADLQDPLTTADPSIPDSTRQSGSASALAPPRAAPGVRPLPPPDGVEVYLQGGDKRYPLARSDGSPPPGRGDLLSGGGVSYRLWPHIMIGALVKLDQAAAANGEPPNQISYHGWLAGPVASVQIAPGVSLDASAAWGAAGEGGVAAELERRQVKARLASTQTYGRWRFAPTIALDYVEAQSQAPFEESSARSGSGQLNVRPELSYRFDLGGTSFIEPKAALSTVWGIGGLNELSPPALAHEDVHLKAEAGFTLGTQAGAKIEATGGIEDGGTGAPDIWSGRLRFNVPLK